MNGTNPTAKEAAMIYLEPVNRTARNEATRYVARIRTSLELARIHGPEWEAQELQELLEEALEDLRLGL